LFEGADGGRWLKDLRKELGLDGDVSAVTRKRDSGESLESGSAEEKEEERKPKKSRKSDVLS
jgi:hypothetical protein